MNFSEIKNTFFFEPKNDGNLILTDYWKVFVLNFLEMGNTFFFGDKKLVERWYLLITEKFLFWTFREWEIRSFLRQKVDRKMIFTDYWKILVLGHQNALVLNFSVMGNTVFFYPKIWRKDNIYLVFLSFPWYSRDWKIRAV